jgi:hypothetical protein
MMHRLVQFHAIHRQPAVDAEVDLSPPDPGNLPPSLLKALCEALAEHTSTAGCCYFCLWEGYGWADELRAAVPETQRVRLPHRDYLLFEGPLEGAAEFGWSVGDHLVSQSPNLFWPEDRSWCVASEIDLNCTLVGGSVALMEHLAADPRLEVWRVGAEDPVTWDSDDKNV